MRIAREEIFGPVLSVLTFDTPEEAARIANATKFGLSAGVWTRDLDTAIGMSRAIHAGTIWINTFLDGYPELPFGGYKESGLGREFGRFSIDAFTELKSVQMHLGPRTSWWMDRTSGSTRVSRLVPVLSAAEAVELVSIRRDRVGQLVERTRLPGRRPAPHWARGSSQTARAAT